MKKITFKITAFLFLAMCTFQTNAQDGAPVGALNPDADGFGFYNTQVDGTWKVKIKDPVDGETLFLTVDNNLKAVFSAELPNDNVSQLWVFSEHPNNVSNYYITSAVPNLGVLQADVNTDATPDLIVAAAGAFDEMQMRKWHQVEDDFTANSQLPGQNAIFIASDREGTPWGDGAPIRIGVAPIVKDATIEMATSISFALRFKLIEAAEEPLSNDSFDASSVFVSNPVNNQLTIKGLNSDITKLSVYNLLGSKVLTQNVSGTSSLNINVSNLVSGMYIVKLEGANGAFSKKIIKQ